MEKQEIRAAREAAEAELGFNIPDEVADKVLAYAKRKCSVIGKPESYLPLLFQNELADYFMRLAINLRGGRNYGFQHPGATA